MLARLAKKKLFATLHNNYFCLNSLNTMYKKKKLITIMLLLISFSFPMAAMGQENGEAVSNCTDLGRISMSSAIAKDGNLTKIRLKLARNDADKLVVAENYLTDADVIIEQEKEQTYFTLVPKDGKDAIALQPHGDVLTFTIESDVDSDQDMIYILDNSYINLGDEKITVGDEPIYLTFEETCPEVTLTSHSTTDQDTLPTIDEIIAPEPELATEPTTTDGEINLVSLENTKVVFEIGANIDASSLEFRINQIPYKVGDEMLSITDWNVSITPVVALEVDSIVDLIVNDLTTDNEIFSTSQTVWVLEDPQEMPSATWEIVDEDLAALIAGIQEDDAAKLFWEAKELTSEDCDLLYQVQQSVLEIHQPLVQKLRSKLDCPTPTYDPTVVSFVPWDETAPPKALSSSILKPLGIIGWILFILLLLIHEFQKMRMKSKMKALQNAYDTETLEDHIPAASSVIPSVVIPSTMPSTAQIEDTSMIEPVKTPVEYEEMSTTAAPAATMNSLDQYNSLDSVEAEIKPNSPIRNQKPKIDGMFWVDNGSNGLDQNWWEMSDQNTLEDTPKDVWQKASGHDNGWSWTPPQGPHQHPENGQTSWWEQM